MSLKFAFQSIFCMFTLFIQLTYTFAALHMNILLTSLQTNIVAGLEFIKNHRMKLTLTYKNRYGKILRREKLHFTKNLQQIILITFLLPKSLLMFV